MSLNPFNYKKTMTKRDPKLNLLVSEEDRNRIFTTIWIDEGRKGTNQKFWWVISKLCKQGYKA